MLLAFVLTIVVSIVSVDELSPVIRFDCDIVTLVESFSVVAVCVRDRFVLVEDRLIEFSESDVSSNPPSISLPVKLDVRTEFAISVSTRVSD